MKDWTQMTAYQALVIAAIACATGAQAASLQIADEAASGVKTYAATAAYARETLDASHTQAASDENDRTRYYVIDDTLTVSAPARVGAHRQDTWSVRYELENMVFASKVEHTPRLTSRLVAGGLAGDAFALFRSQGKVDPGEELRLRAEFAIAADDADTGTVRRSTENASAYQAGKADASETLHGTDIVVLRAALVEQIDPAPATPLADTKLGYATFEPRAGSSAIAAAIGRVRIGVVRPALRNARTRGERIENLSDLTELGRVGIVHTDAGTDAGNTFHIEGDLSFASSIGLAIAMGNDAGAACAGKLRTLAPDKKQPWARTAPIAIDNDWERARWICVKTNGETTIPSTRPYRAVTTYGTIAEAPFGPQSATHSIGRIEREGTSFPIAVLKGGGGWIQQLIVTNRAGAARYGFIEWETDAYPTIEWETDAPLSPVGPGKHVWGTFEPGVNTVDIRDIMDIEHWANASVTLAIDADPHAMSATLERRTHSGRGMESIVLEAEQDSY